MPANLDIGGGRQHTWPRMAKSKKKGNRVRSQIKTYSDRNVQRTAIHALRIFTLIKWIEIPIPAISEFSVEQYQADYQVFRTLHDLDIFQNTRAAQFVNLQTCILLEIPSRCPGYAF